MFVEYKLTTKKVKNPANHRGGFNDEAMTKTRGVPRHCEASIPLAAGFHGEAMTKTRGVQQ
jgi:hypothetical protein